jgi:hypothetical protein
MDKPFAPVPPMPPVSSAAQLRARSMGLALVLGLTFAVTGLMALIAAWMYWIVPSLLA